MDKTQIAIVIPSYEPNGNLPRLVRDLRAVLQNRIIIVNDGSDPEKYDIFFQEALENSGVTLLEHDKNRGKGAALKTAFRHCMGQKIPGVVTADSDGQHLPEDIANCIEALAETPDELILGVRNIRNKEVPFKSRFGNTITCHVFFLLTGRMLSDTQTGLRGISAESMPEYLELSGNGFEFETQMLWKAKKLAIPYREIGIATVYEAGNSGTHFRPFRDSWRIYKALFWESLLLFFLFICSSLFSFLVDISCFCLFYYLIFRNLKSANLLLSVIIARCISAVANYLLNRNLVFKGASGKFHDWKSFSQFTLLCILTMLASYLMTSGMTKLFPNGNVAFLKCTVDLILFCSSFLLQKLVIFKSK